MPVSYVIPGDDIEHDQLKALTAEFDAILTMAFGGLSWLAFDLGAQLPRAFTVFIGDIGDRFFFPSEPEYDHAPFTAYVAAAVIDSYDDALELAKVDDTAIEWFLDGSLEAHTVSHVPTGGTVAKPYWLSRLVDPLFTDPLMRERYRRFDTLDVVFDGGEEDAFTWPANWDKYHCLRFHNLRDADLTITLPGGKVVNLQPFGIKAIRRAYPHGSTWFDAYTYLWEPIPGDQLIWEPVPPELWAPDTTRFSNLTTLSFFQRAFDLLATQPILFRDPSKQWVPSSIGPYQPIGDDRLFIDYRIAPGTVYSVRDALTSPVFDTLSWSTWDELEAGIGDDGSGDPIIQAVPIAGGWTLTGVGTNHDVMGITSELFPALHPVTLPVDVLHGISFAFNTTAATQDIQTVTASWRPDPTDPPGVPSSYVDVEVDATVFGSSLHSTTVAGDLTFGESKTFSTAGLVSTADDLTYIWNNWELVLRTEVEFDAEHAEIIATDGLTSRLQKSVLWQAGISAQYSRQFRLPSENVFLSLTPEVEIAPVRIKRRLCVALAFEDPFGNWHYTGHPDLEGGEGLPGGIEFEFNRKAVTESPIARRGLTSGAVMTQALPVRPLADIADRVLGLSSTAYAAIREDLLDGVVTDEENAQLIRIPICSEQFNIAAGLINSIVWVVPQTINLSTWWELGSGGSPLEGVYVPTNFGRFADPAGRATDLGMIVRNLADPADPFNVLHYVTKNDLNIAATAKGWPYFASELEVPVDNNSSGNWIRGEGGPWCGQFLQAVLAAKWSHGGTVDVYPDVPGYPTENVQWASPTVRLQDFSNLAAAPTGWELKRDARAVTRPVPSIIYDSSATIPAGTPLDTVERIVQAAELEETRAWLVSYLQGAGLTLVTVDGLSDIYEASWDAHAATFITMVKRTGYARTP